MLIRYALLLVLLFPAVGFSQSSIQNEDDLLVAIVALKPDERTAAESLLEERNDLVTSALWDRLVEGAIASSRSGNLPKALFILDVARVAAEQLNDRRLIASTIYCAGKLHSGEGAYVEKQRFIWKMYMVLRWVSTTRTGSRVAVRTKKQIISRNRRLFTFYCGAEEL